MNNDKKYIYSTGAIKFVQPNTKYIFNDNPESYFEICTHRKKPLNKFQKFMFKFCFSITVEEI